ncbi:MAG: hypothetical protein M1828_002757 [Chrysothrix sp. TS-e1954]|nr:MAG: hypothetical protein M1828_002757 [Chrysothrix sp. TS-e1954]
MPPAPEPSSHPTLTPQFCLNTTALRDFLRLSRATVDDSISAHLNALLTPSRSNPFQPSTTSSRSLATTPRTGQNIPGGTCRQFKQSILFPGWQSRENVLQYCQTVADAPDGNPTPNSTSTASSTPLHHDSSITDRTPIASMVDSPSGARTTRNYWNKEQVVDERTDPYSARNYDYTREPQTQILNDVLTNERGVERIVRSRTWNVLGERCLGREAEERYAGWDSEWREWRMKQGELH